LTPLKYCQTHLRLWFSFDCSSNYLHVGIYCLHSCGSRFDDQYHRTNTTAIRSELEKDARTH